jgi:hypothetical protein
VQNSVLFRLQNHGKRRTILNAAAGVHCFVFYVNVGVKIFFVRDKRSVADTERRRRRIKILFVHKKNLRNFLYFFLFLRGQPFLRKVFFPRHFPKVLDSGEMG